MTSLTDRLKLHLSDTTAMLIINYPFFTSWEKIGLGFSDDVSLHARMTGTALSYLGAGYIFSKGRDLSYRLLHKGKGGRYARVHDTVYTAAMSTVLSAGIYTLSGASLEDITTGAVSSGVLGIVMGAPVGYAIDAARELRGVSSTSRLPESVKKRSASVKACIAALAVAVSIGLVATIYAATPQGFRGVKGYIVDAVQSSETR